MDKSTISDIRQRVARWQKEGEKRENWIFAVNIDDVELLLATIARLEVDNEALRLNLFQAREQLAYAPVKLDAAAIEPDQPDCQPKYWFEINTGPYKADDTAMQRSHPWSRGPFASWNEANDEWKKFLKRQRENGQL